MDDKPTYARALEQKSRAIKNFSLPRTDLKKEFDEAVAENALEADLGQHSDVQRVYNLDQVTRDRLLVHARKDAALAVQYSSSLVDEVRAIRKTVDTVVRNTFYILLCGFLSYSWKTGLLSDWWRALIGP